MAYRIKFSNDTKAPLQINDKDINVETSLDLIGKNVYNYGQPIAESFLHLMENFASDVPPREPVEGQLWFDTDDNGIENFKYRHDNQWKYLPGNMFKVLELKDVDGITSHVVTAIMDQGDIIGVVSSEEFSLHTSDPYYDDFKYYLPQIDDRLEGQLEIKAGITLKDGLMFHGTATSAQYADLAELYVSDEIYSPGTLVKLGGEFEVTQTTGELCADIFGVVSENPAYLMNSMQTGVTVPVALAGRVPCKVIGKIEKGQRLVSSAISGVARGVSKSDLVEAFEWYHQVGRALEDKTTEEIGTVEIAVGQK